MLYMHHGPWMWVLNKSLLRRSSHMHTHTLTVKRLALSRLRRDMHAKDWLKKGLSDILGCTDVFRCEGTLRMPSCLNDKLTLRCHNRVKADFE